MITVEQIKDAGVAALKAEGYAGNLFGTRRNGNGSTTFSWVMSKDGKNYIMENQVTLGNVSASDLPTFIEVFKGDLKNAREVPS
jgi:hypothetical protein